ncbi:MAG: carboxymuconolactone decarboxylase family protein [Gluconacetobacter diazotrophicus]|nr:carboxymuconolactone decarboxylase family protein [Gluconacetobacter diazotrophicus]
MSYPRAYRSAVTIPLPDDDTIRAVIGESYDPDTALNVVKMFAGTEDMFPAVIGLVKAVFTAAGIDPKLRQMIILRAAKVLDAPYEWQANVPMSLNNGLTRDEVDAAAGDGPVEGVTADHVLACRATDEMCRNGTLTDGTLQALRDRFGDVAARKLVLIIAWFNLLSLFLNGCRVPLETTDKIGGKTSPLG